MLQFASLYSSFFCSRQLSAALVARLTSTCKQCTCFKALVVHLSARLAFAWLVSCAWHWVSLKAASALVAVARAVWLAEASFSSIAALAHLSAARSYIAASKSLGAGACIGAGNRLASRLVARDNDSRARQGVLSCDLTRLALPLVAGQPVSWPQAIQRSPPQNCTCLVCSLIFSVCLRRKRCSRIRRVAMQWLENT